MVEKNSSIALPGTGKHSGLLPLKTMRPNLGGLGEELYSNGSRVELLIRLGCAQGLCALIWSQVVSYFLMSFSGFLNLEQRILTLLICWGFFSLKAQRSCKVEPGPCPQGFTIVS